MNLNLLFDRGRLAHNYFLNFLVLSTSNLINRVPGCKQKNNGVAETNHRNQEQVVSKQKRGNPLVSMKVL